MKVINIISNAVTDAVEYLVEKNSIQAQQNRLKMVMRNENNLTQRAYLELGKYYYEQLREKESNERNKALCETIDNSKVRMKKAVDRYKELMIQQENAILEEVEKEESNYTEEVAEDITLCCAYQDEDTEEKEKAEEKTEEKADNKTQEVNETLQDEPKE